MKTKDLARFFYNQAETYGQVRGLPRQAVAEAHFNASLQLFVDEHGPVAAARWLTLRAKAFDNDVAMYPERYKVPNAIA